MLTAQTDPAGRTTRYGYYADGILKTLTDPSGNVTTVERDIQGRPTARAYVMTQCFPVMTQPFLHRSGR